MNASNSSSSIVDTDHFFYGVLLLGTICFLIFFLLTLPKLPSDSNPKKVDDYAAFEQQKSTWVYKPESTGKEVQH